MSGSDLVLRAVFRVECADCSWDCFPPRCRGTITHPLPGTLLPAQRYRCSWQRVSSLCRTDAGEGLEVDSAPESSRHLAGGHQMATKEKAIAKGLVAS